MRVKKKEAGNIRSDIVTRLTFVYIATVIFGIIILIQVFYLQNISDDKWRAKAITLSQKVIYPLRGDICDTHGRILSTSMPSYSVHADFTVPALHDTTFNKNVDSLAFCLANLFKDKTAAEYAKMLKTARKEKKSYILIKNKITHNQLKQLKKFPIFKRGRNKGGLIYEQQNTRETPHLALARRTIGFINKNDDYVGLEGAFNDLLSGKEGMKLMQKLSSGDWRPIDTDNEIEPEDGKDIITTLDVNIQDIVEKSLYAHLTSHNAKHGTVILMEVKTGKIRAMANLNFQESTQTYAEDYNFAVGYNSEPGSTFKLASLIVALDKGNIDIYDTIDTGNGIITIGDFKIKDTKEGGHGKITVKQAFELSSNVGIAKIVYHTFKNRTEEFVDRLYAMNLNKKTGIELKGEPRPNIKYPDDPLWSGVSLAQMAIGYEIELTPLQILTLYNAVANNGIMVKPQILEAIRHHGRIVQTMDVEVINSSICSKETLEKIKLLLLGVVENGTAKNIKSENYKIAGKTGTAQIARGDAGYQTREEGPSYQASFAGYFPADNPKYSCIVVINTPTNQSYYGNMVAGPVFKDIADKLFASDYEMQSQKEFELANFKDINEIPFSKSGNKKMLDKVFHFLNIPVEFDKNINTSWINTSTQQTSVKYTPISIKKGVVPNVKGMCATDALYLLENAGLIVNLVGRGTVKNQSIEPGQIIKSGTKIIIELS